MHVRCLHETDFTLAPGIAPEHPEHPFFPQLEQCFKTNSLDSTAFVSMKGASGHPCTCRSARHDYDYDCSCLLLPASRPSPAFCLISDAAGAHAAQTTIGRASWSLLKTARPLFSIHLYYCPINHTHPTVDRLTCRGQCLRSIHTVATLFHYNSTARRRLSIRLNPPGVDILGLETQRTRP